jgi:hypothetical protein
MTNDIMRKLWWIPALAALAACDPFDDETGGTPAVVTVMATSVDGTDATGVVEDNNGGDGWAVAGVPAGPTVFIVKTNKLLDGLSIQTSASSCVPAASLNLTVNTVANPANWFACYQPGSGTTAEGSSLVVYQGEDIVPGIPGVGLGYFEAAAAQPLAPGSYAVTAAPTDKSGAVLNVSFTVNVVTWLEVEHDAASDDFPVNSSATFSATVHGQTNQAVTWAVVETTGCGSITAGGVYTAPATVPTPATCTIEATSVADPTASETYPITIVP